MLHINNIIPSDLLVPKIQIIKCHLSWGGSAPQTPRKAGFRPASNILLNNFQYKIIYILGRPEAGFCGGGGGLGRAAAPPGKSKKLKIIYRLLL